MILNDVPQHTWISYNGEPYFVYHKGRDKTALMHSDMSIQHLQNDTEVESINVPVFHEGDVVLCVDKESPTYNQLVTILEIRESTPYTPYQIIKNRRATPFDIIHVNY